MQGLLEKRKNLREIFFKTYLFVFLLVASLNAKAIGPAALYFGAEGSVVSGARQKFFSTNPDLVKLHSLQDYDWIINKKISTFAGLRLLSLRVEGKIGYIPTAFFSFQDENSQDVNLANQIYDYSLSGLYDFSFVPMISPYIGAKIGYANAKLKSVSILQDVSSFATPVEFASGYYAGGVLGLDFRIADFLGIGISYSLDYMPFFDSAKIRVSGKEKLWDIGKDMPLFHNVALVFKLGF